VSALASSAYAVDPFGPSANPAAYVPVAASERARALVERALEEGRIAALVGPPGLGKTVILHLVRARQAERSAVAYVPFSNLEPEELFALVLDRLGEHPGDASPRETLLALARGCAERGGILLLVDDAAALPPDTAEALAELVGAADGGLRLALAAVEGPEARRVCGAFGTRVDVVRLSEGMSEREARHYVATRLAWAGARPDLVAAFDDETVAALHRESGGVPRRLNQRAHEQLRRVAPDALPRLAQALGQLTQTEPPESPIPEPPLVLPPSEPPPRALLERDAYRETGGYRLVRGRPVETPAEPPPPLPESRAEERAADEAPAPHSAESPGDVFARLKRPAPPAEETREAPPAEAAAHAPSAPPRAAAVAGPRRSLLFAGAAVFAFVAALAFAWSSGRLAPAALPGLDALEEVAGGAGGEPGPGSAIEAETVPAPPATAAAPEVPARDDTAVGAVADPAPERAPQAAGAETAPPARPRASASAEASAPAATEPVVAATPEEPETAAPEPAPTPEPEPATAAVRAPQPAPVPATPVPAPAEPPPAAAEPVPVAINAIPWAEVSVDGRPLGETPLAGIRLAPGPHTFRARMPDGTTREQTVDIAPDRRTVVFE